MYKVGLIGLGMSGARFIRALNYLNKKNSSYVLIGVYDKNKDNYDLLKEDIKTYNSLLEFMKNDIYDVIIVSVNEEAHYEILVDLKKHLKRCKKYIVEKPLVSNYNELEMISSVYNDFEIIVNYVERNSKIVEKINEYIQTNNLDIIRMHFFWGKCRLYDSRPTIGVTSEIVHPLDLCFYFLNAYKSDIRIIQGNYIKSDYSISGSNIIDTIDINIMVDNKVVISGNSSFLWGNRKRELTFYLQPKDSTTNIKYVVYMFFDFPRWDIDGYSIYKISSTGEREEIMNYTTSNSANNETMCITKIVKLLQDIEKELKDDIIFDRLHHLKQSYSIQKVIDEISRSNMYLNNCVFKCNTEKKHDNIREHLQSIKCEKYNSIMDTGY